MAVRAEGMVAETAVAVRAEGMVAETAAVGSAG